jgi:hypothetical protein
MSHYLYRLLEYVDKGGKLVQPAGKPVSRGLVEMLADYLSSPREVSEAGIEHVYGTNMNRIRTGLVLERVIDGVWYVILGRKCSSLADIRPDACLKTAGGYARLSTGSGNEDDLVRIRIAERDPSVKRALIRELEEEGFGGQFRLKSDSVLPLSVSHAKPEGMLHFYLGRLKHYPDFPDRGRVIPYFPKVNLHVLKEFPDGKKIFVNYFAIDEVLELAGQEVSLVHRETVEAVVDAYFWQRCSRLYMRPVDNDFADEDGDLSIPPDQRRAMFSRLGIPARDDNIRLKKCRVYYSLPHQSNIFALRMFLATDLFVHVTEFDEEEICALLGGEGKMRNLQDVAPNVVKRYLGFAYSELLRNELFANYVRHG